MTRLPDHHRLSRRTLLSASAAAIGSRAWGAGMHARQAAPTIVWEEITPGTGGPAPRWDHILVPDSAANRLILFGGRDGNGVSLGDTWVFDVVAGAWSQLPGEGPTARFGMAAVVDDDGGGIYLFGGQAGETFYNDLWRYDLALDVWQPLDLGAGLAPSPRYGLGGVSDRPGRFIVSHGFTFEGRFDDTWVFDQSDGGWTDVSPPAGARPLARCLHEQVWDASSGTMLLYGGCSSGVGPCPQGDAWSFDPAAGQWVELTPAASPEPRSNPALVAAPGGSAALLVGGLSAGGYVADGWLGTIADGALTWTALEFAGVAPSPRASHDMATLGDRAYLFGGTDDVGPMGDFWSATIA